MEVFILDGRTVTLKLRGKCLRTESKSKFQHEIGEQLTGLYPHDTIFEEVRVPGEGFILDFFIPSLCLVIEVHGQQHTKHIKHFHKTRRQFHNQQDTDRRKRDWCELNKFKLLEIYDE